MARNIEPGMKFYRAVTKVPLVMDCIMTDQGKHTFPAGTEVSATESGPERWHLNASLDGEHYDGYAATDELEVGAVIATANEPMPAKRYFDSHGLAAVLRPGASDA